MTRFENENTYERLYEAGRSNDFHSKYEAALAEAEEQFLGRRRFYNLIGGKEVEARSYFDNQSPIAPEMIVGSFARGGKEDVSAAMAAAKEAFRDWSHVDLEDRVALFRKAAERTCPGTSSCSQQRSPSTTARTVTKRWPRWTRRSTSSACTLSR